MMDQHRNFEQVFPYFAFEDNLLLMSDGRVGIGYRVQGVEMERLSTGEYNKIGENVSQALKSLEIGACVQMMGFYYYDKPNPSVRDKNYYEERFIHSFGERPIQRHEQYLFISFGEEKDKDYTLTNNSFGRGGKVLENTFKEVASYKRKIESIANSFISMVGIGDLSYQRLTEDDVMKVLCKYFNLDFTPDQYHRSAFRIFKTFTPDKERLILGTDTVNIISMSGQPTNVNNDMDNLYNVSSPQLYALTNYLEIPHILNITFKPLDTQKTYSKIEFEAKNIARLDFLMSEQHRAKSRDMFEFLNEITTNGNSLLNVSVQCLVWKPYGQTEDSIQKVMKAYREIGAESYLESLDTTNLFVSNAPCNGYQNFRWLLMDNTVAACYFNTTTLLKSDKKGDLLSDRMGNPLLIDFYDTVRFENNNSLTIGVPGSGKSFTMGNLILQRFYRGERQIIIDVGGTYLSIFYAIPPDKCRYYEYDPEKPLRYNPFLINYDEVLGEFRLTEAKMEFLINLIATIWRGNSNLNNAERSILNKFLNQYYDEYNKQKGGGRHSVGRHSAGRHSAVPCITGFYDFLKTFQQENIEKETYKKIEKNLNMDELLITLEPFAVGNYKDILNSETFDEVALYPLICFDLAKIKANPTLYPVVGMLIIELSCDIIDKYPKVIKRIYIDEAWSMLDGLLGGFIEYMYRTVRKCEGTISIITQGISEIQNSSIGTVVKDLSSTVIILRHTDSNMIDKIVKFFGLSNQAEDLLKSLRKDAKDKWREIFVKRADLVNVYRVEVPSKIIPLLTSRAEDRNKIREMAEGGKYFDYAINRFVEEWEKEHEI